MSRKILGLDIRSASVSAVLIETGFKKSAFAGYTHVPFSGSGEYLDQLSGALEAICRGMDLKECACILSVPSNRFFFRNLAVPFSEAKKIQQMLPYELETTIPFPVENLLIEFKKLPLPGSNEETRIITAGIEIGRLESFIGAVERCGITPNILTPGGYPMAMWVSQTAQPHEKLILVDFDGSDCTLYLILSGKIAFIRSFPLQPAEADNTARLWGQIRRSIAGFESLHEVTATPDAIILNGFDEASFPKRLEADASVPARVLEVTLPAGSEHPENPNGFLPRSAFNAALSSSLMMIEGFKGMNFRKGPLATKTRLTAYRDGLKKTAILAGVAILLWSFGMLAAIHMKQKSVDQLDAQIISIFKNTFPEKHRIVDPLQQMKSEIALLKKSAFASGEAAVEMRSVDMLKKISQSVPAQSDVHFSKLVAGEDGILITGTTASYNMVDDIKTRLEKVDGFVSVKITSADMDKNVNRVRFKLKIQTNPEEVS